MEKNGRVSKVWQRVVKVKGGNGWQRAANLHISTFLAPTGAQGEAMSCVRASVRDIIQKDVENEF